MISDFYFSAFIMSVMQGGYNIFLVYGKYPFVKSSPQTCGILTKYQRWFSRLEINRIERHNKKKKNFHLNIGCVVPKKKPGEPESSSEEENVQGMKFEAYEGQGISL